MMRIKLGSWQQAHIEASRIRFAVFVEEQRVPIEMEMDEFDPRSLHALAYSPTGEAIGTGRLLPDGHIGRLAVIRDWRGKRVGGSLLELLVTAARERGDAEVALSAQTHAMGFYRRHGFAERGEVYLEAGIPHQEMRRSLR